MSTSRKTGWVKVSLVYIVLKFRSLLNFPIESVEPFTYIRDCIYLYTQILYVDDSCDIPRLNGLPFRKFIIYYLKV